MPAKKNFLSLSSVLFFFALGKSNLRRKNFVCMVSNYQVISVLGRDTLMWDPSKKLQGSHIEKSRLLFSCIMCTSPHPLPPSFLLLGGDWRVEPFTQFSKKEGGLNRTSIFRGVCWERGVTFFRWRGPQRAQSCNIYIKNELKSDKKFYKQKWFSLS